MSLTKIILHVLVVTRVDHICNNEFAIANLSNFIDISHMLINEGLERPQR
jgi:hypothetical protein